MVKLKIILLFRGYSVAVYSFIRLLFAFSLWRCADEQIFAQDFISHSKMTIISHTKKWPSRLESKWKAFIGLSIRTSVEWFTVRALDIRAFQGIPRCSGKCIPTTEKSRKESRSETVAARHVTKLRALRYNNAWGVFSLASTCAPRHRSRFINCILL